MSIAHDARAALEGLWSRFEVASRYYLRLKHVFIEMPAVEAPDAILKTLGFAFPNPVFPYREQAWDIAVERITRGTGEIHVFVESDCHRGRDALDALESLAGDAVEILTDYDLPERAMLHPDVADSWNYATATRWMTMVHEMAHNRRPGDLLRSERERHVNGHFLPEGTFACTLRPAAFKASSLVIERILADGMEQADSEIKGRPAACDAAALSRTTTGEKKPKHRRNEGKMAQCRGIYINDINSGKNPPSPTELARRVGCDKGTATRAIKDTEALRKELAKRGAGDRHRERGGPESLRNKIRARCATLGIFLLSVTSRLAAI
jgi:hypothetical protein